MGFGDKITPALAVIAAIVAAGHIIIGAYSVSNINWIHFKVSETDKDIREFKTRTRGLNVECVDNEPGKQSLQADCTQIISTQ